MTTIILCNLCFVKNNINDNIKKNVVYMPQHLAIVRYSYNVLPPKVQQLLVVQCTVTLSTIAVSGF